MEMKDVSSYSQKDKERKPRVLCFEDESSGFCFKVHRHIYYPDTWLLSCDGLCDKEDLKTDDLEEAKKKAFQRLKEVVNEKASLLRRIANEIEKDQVANGYILATAVNSQTEKEGEKKDEN